MRASAHFTPVLFEFLSDLSENNNREWFQANKDRYERDVRDPPGPIRGRLRLQAH